MIFEFKNKDISRGDIVLYCNNICYVCEKKYTTETFLINLHTGLIEQSYDNIYSMREDNKVSLIAKNDDIKLSNREQEVPF